MEEAKSQFETIRREGHCNMLDKSCVKSVASQCGFDELVEVIEDGNYMDIIESY